MSAKVLAVRFTAIGAHWTHGGQHLGLAMMMMVVTMTVTIVMMMSGPPLLLFPVKARMCRINMI